MLQESANVNSLLAAPWTLAPAILLFVVVFSVQMAGGERPENNLLLTRLDP